MGDDGEVSSVVARLARLADRGAIEEYVELFTEDAVWVVPDVPQTGVKGTELRGRDAIAAAARQRRADGLQGPGTNTAHVITTTDVRVKSDDLAIAESYWHFVMDTATAPRIQAFGAYRDTFLRTHAGWRLARREITVG